jgi:hypothetical protein
MRSLPTAGTPPNIGQRQPSPSAVAALRQRVAVLRATISAAEAKRRGIDTAITSRRQALERLTAQLALSESGSALLRNE